MISVPIDRIVPLTDARDNFSRLVADVENISDGLYVLTKGGKPAIALINIKYLEEIMTKGPSPDHQPISSSATRPEISKTNNSSSPGSEKKSVPSAVITPPKPPSYEPPKVAASPSPSKPSSPPANNYDVKPSVNPSWTGEITKPSSASTLAPTPSPAPAAQATPPSVNKPVKPPVNPCPIIPPKTVIRSEESQEGK